MMTEELPLTEQRLTLQHADNTTSMMTATSKKSILDKCLKIASSCDKFFNCAYVKKQVEEEWQQEARLQDSAMNRVWGKMEKSVEVDLYRQFLFDEESVVDTAGDCLDQVPELQRSDTNSDAGSDTGSDTGSS